MIFVLSAFGITSPFIADLLRPLVLIGMLRSLRFSLVECGKDFYASMVILLTIFAWIIIFAITGFYLFRYQFEGIKFFTTFLQSVYSMVIALTTANFPDVLLPAYRDNYWTMLFFIVYMLIGLYFLLNLLIANVFSKYKGRLEERIVAHETRRHTMVEQVYK